MKYLKSIIYLLSASFIISCNSSQEGIRVSGTIDNPLTDESIIINQFESTGIKPIDTVSVNDSGEYSFLLNPSEPTFYRVNFFDRQQVNLILEGNEEEVTLNVDGNNPQGKAEVSGAKHTKYLQQLEGMMKDQQSDVQDLNQQAIQARMDGDQEAMERLTNEYYDLMRVRQREIKDYIWSISPSLAAFYGLRSLNPEEHFQFYDSLAQKFNEKLPNHLFTADLQKQVESLRKLAIGAQAPEIALPSPEGDTIKLSSLKGNYVLIDFWAAWCKPCRAENPNVVRMYNKYGGENFEILGVSLDRNRAAWVKAIEQDGLPWKHVSDLKYFNSQAAADYRINSIPATYLIGPDGKIIAKGLRGPTLEAKLDEIFG